MSQNSLKIRNLFLITFIAFLLPELAFAAPQAGTATQSLGLFKDGAFSFYNNITPGALKLLWSLTGASFAYLAFRNVIEAQPFEKTLSLLVRTCFYPAVYTLFIYKGIEWLPNFIDVATFFGQKGTGETRSLNPDAIFNMGIDLQNAMVVGFNDAAGTGLGAALTNFVPSILLSVVCITVIAAFGFMAGMVYWFTAEAFILIAIAPILFALGAGHWTKDIGQKPWNSMIGVTVKLIILYIVLSIAISAIPSWGVLASQWALDNWGPLWKITWQAVLFAFLAIKIPTMAQNALTGSASLSPGEALQIAATAIAAGVGAAAGAGKVAGSAIDSTYGATKNAASLASFNNRNSINPLDDMRSPKSSNANLQMPWDTGGAGSDNGNSNAKPILPRDVAADINKKSGNASQASIGGDKSNNQNQDSSRSKTDSIRSAIETVGRVIPNDQAAAGGDLVKNHKD